MYNKRDRDSFENNNNKSICNNNNDNNDNNDNNNIDNNNERNNKIFNSVWNNKYLKRIIFSYLLNYNILYNNITFNTLKDWNNFKYKDYLYQITIPLMDFKLLPENIKKINITLDPLKMNFETKEDIPDHIESVSLSELKLEHLNSEFIKSISSKLQKIKLNLEKGQQIEPNLIPESIIHLKIQSTKLKLSKNVLPKNLKSLSTFIIESFEDECLPSSLTHIHSICANPLLINQMSNFNNLVKLKFSSSEGLSIENNIMFPNSLLDLSIICGSFNASLPENLESFTIYLSNYDHQIKFPDSIKSISFEYSKRKLNHEVFKSKSDAPANLKKLILTCSSIIDSDGQSILPDKLETLIIKDRGSFYNDINKLEFNEEFKANQLPSTLTYLDVGNKYISPIGFNVLPSKLNALVLGDQFYKSINPLSIPESVKLINIKNEDYNQQLDELSRARPNTLIKCLYRSISFSSVVYGPIFVLYLPNGFNSPLSTLYLKDKSSLVHLHLGDYFNYEIKESDLPIKNNIKILELSRRYTQDINLEYFPNVEIIVLNNCYLDTFNINTTKTISPNGEVIYNYYKLKEIRVDPSLHSFIKNLDSNFYQFIKKKSYI